jgi:HK97 family phage major capsid protein
MLKALLEKRGRLAKRLAEIGSTETLTEELRKEAGTITADLDVIKKDIDERNAMAQTVEAASQQVTQFRAPDGTTAPESPVITASVPSGLRVYTAKRFGTRAEAGNRAFEAGQWLRAFKGNRAALEWCRTHGLETRGIVENDNASGGSLVPVPLSTTIIELIEEYGIMRSLLTREIMSSDTLTMSKRTGGVTGYWVAEAGSITASAQTYKPVTLTAHKLAALVKYSSEVSEDAIVSLADKVMMECGQAFAYEEDDAIVNGTGATTYGGIKGLINAGAAGVTISTVADHDEFSEVTDGDILYGRTKLAKYTRNVKILTSPVCNALVFARLARAAGGATLAEMTNTGLLTNYAGIPIVISNVFPETDGVSVPFCCIGDFGQAGSWGARREITFKRLVEKYADTDEEAIQATERFGAVIHETGTASAAGSYAVLTTHS